MNAQQGEEKSSPCVYYIVQPSTIPEMGPGEIVATVEGSDLVQPVSSAEARSKTIKNRFISYPSFLSDSGFILLQNVVFLNKEPFRIFLRKV